MLLVWNIYLHLVKNGYIQGEMYVNIPYMEHLGVVILGSGADILRVCSTSSVGACSLRLL